MKPRKMTLYPANTAPTFLSKNQVLARLTISNTTFYKLVSEQKFRMIKIGRSTKVPIVDIDYYEAELLSSPVFISKASYTKSVALLDADFDD